MDIKESALDFDPRPSSRQRDSGDGRSRLGPYRRGFPVRKLDREPGELSSDSSSDEAEATKSRMKNGGGAKIVETGTKSPIVKKRKFSPIIWDRDDNGDSRVSRNRSVSAVSIVPPPQPLARTTWKSPDVILNCVSRTSPENKVLTAEHSSPVKPHMAYETLLPSLTHHPTSPLNEHAYRSKHELQDEKGEDYLLTRHISSSRWAASNYSPVDEGEILDHHQLLGSRTEMPHEDSLQVRQRNKSLTPKVRELQREDFRGSRERSSESNEQSCRSRSISCDGIPDTDAEKYSYMDMDEENDRRDSSGSQSDTDSEGENKLGELQSSGPQRRSINMLQGCRRVDEFERLNKINEGTYGVVYRARDKKNGGIVALKKVKMEKEREGFPLTALREMNILLSFHHPSVVEVKEVVVGSSLDSIFMVMEYMEHDIKELMEAMKQPFSQSEVKCLMLQLLEGVKYLHDNWVLHRDLKTSNLLLNNLGELKIADFGLARQYGSPLKPYTHLVVTLWYRAPELLLGMKEYSTAIDMWSLGCIMAELLAKEPLFNGRTEIEQLNKIYRILGTPNETIWPGFSKLPGVKVNFVKHQYNLLRKKFPGTSFTGSPVLSDAGFDLLNKLLTYDPKKRITANDALSHQWFQEVPLPKSKEFMPTFPEQNARNRRLPRITKSPDPLEEQRRKELRGTGGVFG